MSTLVTGGTGFIGPAIVTELVRNGEDTIVLDLSPRLERLENVTDSVTIVQADICNLDELLRIGKQYKIKTVVHTARSPSTTLESESRPAHCFKVNIQGASNVLEMARLIGAERFVYLSSAAVYRHVNAKVSLKEDDAIEFYPTYVYRTTKLAAEALGLSYLKLGLDFVALRLSQGYGPYGHGIESKIISKAFQGAKHSILTHRFAQDFVYVKDTARAVVLACNAPTLKSHIYNVASGETHSYAEFLKIVKKHVPQCSVEIVLDRKRPAVPIEMLERRQPLDINKATQELGFKPQYDLEEGIKDYISWHKSEAGSFEQSTEGHEQ